MSVTQQRVVLVHQKRSLLCEFPFGITLAHNGNLTNAHLLRRQLFETARRHINTTSDSEILLNVLAYELDRFDHFPLEPDNIFAAVAAMHKTPRCLCLCCFDYRPWFTGFS